MTGQGLTIGSPGDIAETLPRTLPACMQSMQEHPRDCANSGRRVLVRAPAGWS